MSRWKLTNDVKSCTPHGTKNIDNTKGIFGPL